MIKRPGGADGSMQVTFEVDAAVRADRANLCGEFNSWATDAHPMERKPDGGFEVTLSLEPGRAYRFRYLLDGERWENDWAADDYVPNEYGGDDSLVDLTKTDGQQPPPVKKAGGAKKAAGAKKAEGTKKAAAKKAAPAKKAADKGPAKKAPSKQKSPEA